MNKLKIYRRQIDKIDEQLIKILKKRMIIVRQIGVWKKQNQMPPLDQVRWQRVIDSKLKLTKKLNLDPAMIKEIYEIIHKYALEIEKNL